MARGRIHLVCKRHGFLVLSKKVLVDHSIRLRGTWQVAAAAEPNGLIGNTKAERFPIQSPAEGKASRKWHRPSGLAGSQKLVLQLNASCCPAAVFLNLKPQDVLPGTIELLSGENRAVNMKTNFSVPGIKPFFFTLTVGLHDYNEIAVVWDQAFELSEAVLLIVSPFEQMVVKDTKTDA